MPGGIAYDLAADPTNPNVFYTAVVGADTFGGANGIYKTTNAGATWTKVSTHGGGRFLLQRRHGALHNPPRPDQRGQVGPGLRRHRRRIDLEPGYDQLAAVFRSGNGGTTWTPMDMPTTVDSGATHPLLFPRDYRPRPAIRLGTLPSGQGTVDFSIVADPTNANIVYIGGYEQLSIGAASAIGATDYTGVLFRGDASTAAGKQWVSFDRLEHEGSRGRRHGQQFGPARRVARHDV